MFQRAFSVSTREQAALVFVAGGHSPTGVFVAWCNVGTFVRLCFGVSCDICAGTFLLCDRGRRGHVVAVAVSRPSWPWLPRLGRHTRSAVPWTSWPWLWCPLSLCRRRVVATRRRTLVFAMVLTESHYPDLRNQLVAYKMGANKQTTTKRKERYGSGYADRDGNPEAPKNRRHGRLKTEEWTRQGCDGLRLGMMHPHTMQG